MLLDTWKNPQANDQAFALIQSALGTQPIEIGHAQKPFAGDLTSGEFARNNENTAARVTLNVLMNGSPISILRHTEPLACPRCGTAWCLEPGLCVSCLLSCGLDSEMHESFKGFVNCTNPNPPNCGGTWESDPGNSGHPPDTVPADMTVIVSSLGWEQRLLSLSGANHLCPVGAARKNLLSASLLDVDLTHPFLLPNNLDLMA